MTVKTKLYYAFYDSPIGVLKISSSDEGIIAIALFECDKENMQSDPETIDADYPAGNTIYKHSGSHPIIIQAKVELDQYFAGKRKEFDVPVKILGTDFQVKAWRALYAIPFGMTKTYGAIASEIGDGKASRAVGLACKKNPLLIIVPCHRVIGTNNKLTGFNIGLDRKRFLLEHENIEICK